jgi:hypothetical protein
MGEDLFQAITEALQTLTTATGLDAQRLFGDREIEDLSGLPSQVAFDAGVIEGAGVALDLTALELLDAVGLPSV